MAAMELQCGCWGVGIGMREGRWSRGGYNIDIGRCVADAVGVMIDKWMSERVTSSGCDAEFC